MGTHLLDGVFRLCMWFLEFFFFISDFTQQAERLSMRLLHVRNPLCIFQIRGNF